MIKNFLKDENGQGMVEYALIIGLISIVVIGAVIAIGKAINDNFEAISESLGGAQA